MPLTGVKVEKTPLKIWNRVTRTQVKITAGYDNSDSEEDSCHSLSEYKKPRKDTIHSPDCWMHLDSAHVNFVPSTPIRIHM